MVIKLIRVDTQEPSKIPLKIGKHVIGRGKFLHNDHSDKRVSQNHAELEVTDDSISLKALHSNPCYYIKKNIGRTDILELNETVTLGNGDKFGLIPDQFWYEIVFCTTIQNYKDPTNKESEAKKEEGNTEEVASQSIETYKDVAEKPEIEEPANTDVVTTEDALAKSTNVEDEETKKSSSPSLISEQTDQNKTKQEQGNQQEDSELCASKRNLQDSCPADVKKFKTDNDMPDTQHSNDTSDSDLSDQKFDGIFF